MNFSIATLLANFSDEKLVAPKALEKKLNCDNDENARKLQIALDALEKINILTKERGRYRRNAEEDLIEGRLRCSSKGFCFAIQQDEAAEDIYIRESHLNTAWNGDQVLVRVTKEGTRRRSPEGEVKLILERANQSVLGRVKQAEERFQAVPLDDRLLFELELKPDDIGLEESVDKLVHVEILRYPLGQNPPLGRVAQVLGIDAETASDIDIVCCKHDLPREFSDEVNREAKKLPTKLRKGDISDRLDLRELPTVRISGPHVTDNPALDDALSVEVLDEERWRVGVHIADITHYIEPDSALDQAAQSRGTSIHLGETVLPMLPEMVYRRCSLTPESDRLTISVLITLDSEGNVVEYEIQPTIISVDHEIDYLQAQAIIERDAPEVEPEAADEQAEASDGEAPPLPYQLPSREEIQPFEPIFSVLDQLMTLSKALADQRHQRGAFELNLPEKLLPEGTETGLGKYFSTKFEYDDEGAIGAMVVSSVLPARSLVIELMILANQLVATHLRELGVPMIYRVHRAPDPANVQELLKLVANMDIDPTLEEEDTVQPRDYQRLTQQFAQSKAEKVLTYLLLDTLKPANYSSNPGHHFGLALDEGYTHFTAPLRRYPDMLVHRVLHAVFSQGRDRRSARSKERVNLRHSSCHGKISWNVLPTKRQGELEELFTLLVSQLTDLERKAQDAEADLEGLKKAEFMQQHTGSAFHGLITGVQSYGFFVEIEELLVEGLVHVSSLKDDWYEYRSRQQKLVGRKNRKQYRLGDRVEVQVKSVDYYRQQIDLVAVGGGSEASESDLEDDDFDDENGNGHDENGYDD
ncbi:MAG: ribonuclease R family protein [Cyanobacteria bacterium P01_A01_bin.135]